ncbi:TIGR02647 family protein [Halieaceae bacterium IMCC14734]|uniref:TIGR02647 family protein n=1 Tax=Candidatus Litorirhabdus singularis TaxID=2518993 RepID=A0ABT3TBF3_9GAMM|nr:TIGR02647 family protein [Candidatus Litorirhabdus singularis]MCX2979618.1 TIGR02647 family protein [Candidatus Litorirhabdus singularis]
MPFTPAIMEEMNLLLQFDSASLERGIKVHSDARPEVIEACQSLHTKGLVSNDDGGYLTNAGIEAQTHAQALSGMLRPEAAAVSEH